MADQTQDVSQDNFVDDSTPTDALSGAPDATSDLENQAAQNVPVGVSALIQQQANQNQPADDAQSDADMDDQDNPSPSGSMWKNLVLGALAGIAGVGPHTRTFGGGLVQGAGNELQQQQQQKDNALKTQQVANQTTAADDEHQNAQARLAIAHVQQMNLTRMYDLAPKSQQDLIDQASAQQDANLEAAGDVPVEGGSNLSHTAALALQTQLHASGGDKALNFTLTKASNGDGYNVRQMSDPTATNDSPVQVTLGYKLNSDGTSTPITQTAPAHTITNANLFATNAAAASNEINRQNTVTQGKIDANNAASKLKSDSDKNIVAGMLDGSLDITKIANLRDGERERLVGLAKAQDPTFNMQTYADRLQTSKSFAAGGKGSDQIVSLNTFAGHLAEANDGIESLRNTNSQLVNSAWNSLSEKFGNTALAPQRAALEAVKDEYLNFLKAGHAPQEAELKVADGLLSTSQTPAQTQSTLRKMAQIVKIRTDSMSFAYQRTMGKPLPDVYDPDTVSTLAKFGINVAPQSGAAKTQTPTQTPQQAAPQAAPQYRRDPATNKVQQSTDGGKTWQ